MKKALLIVLICICAAGLIVMGIFLWKHFAGKDSGQTAVLQGKWTEVNAWNPENAGKIEIRSRKFFYTDYDGAEKKCSYSFGEAPLALNGLTDPVWIAFDQGEGPDCGGYLYHTQEVDGHTVRIFSSFMEELDGRGLIVDQEFVHDDDLQYVTSDFKSELYHQLNDAEAPATYIEVEE